jgi:uncharacterized protein (TIGR03083 family)
VTGVAVTADRAVDRRLRLDHAAWTAAALEEHVRLRGLLDELDEDDWSRPTECTEWDVRALVAHLAGAAASTASPRELLRQARRGARLRPGGPAVDGMNAVQVQERAGIEVAALRADLEVQAERGRAARRRLPAPLRALRLPFGPPLGVRPLGYLVDRIATRDAWLHRIDVARATGRTPVLTAEHDALLVADVVEEWARAHGRPFRLRLTGPAGGTYVAGRGGAALELDAVDFCRVLSGRAPGDGLLATPVPF